MLTDKQIESWCSISDVIVPFTRRVDGDGIISYGLTSAGYDIRLGGNRVLIFKNTYNQIIRPKLLRDNPEAFSRVFDVIENIPDHEEVILPPHGYMLGYSVERFCVPDTVKGHCVGKSTYARCGIIINTTPLEPGWIGHLTIEIANSTPSPVAITIGEGIAQLELFALDDRPRETYADKAGKYQDQTADPHPARVK